MKKLNTIICFVLLTSACIYAQKSTLTVKLIDKLLNEPIPFGNVLLEKDGEKFAKVQTNLDGEAKFDSVPFGKYNLLATFIGFETIRKEIEFKNNKNTLLEYKLEQQPGCIFPIVEIISIPPFKFEMHSGQTFTHEQLRNSPY